ncbi:MAG: phage shock protein A [Lentimonas sp.]|jgi:phage shock protein A
MSDAESITELQSQLTHLERHIAEQDAEFYQLAKRVDALTQLVQAQKAQLSALSSGGVAGDGDMPANEKPPHY